MTLGTATDRADLTAWLGRQLPLVAPAWLPTQRWFGGKTHVIESVAVADVFWLPTDGPARALVVLDVRYGGSAPGAPAFDRYALLVGIVADPTGLSSIGRLTGPDERHAVELTTEALAMRALLRGLTTEQHLVGERGGEITYADATPHTRELLAADIGGPTVVPVGVEQSNTSVRVGTTHVFKLFRRLEDGDNPQLEIGRFLAGTTFRAAPPLEGSLEYHAPGQSGSALGALEGWVPNAGDGWTYVVAALKQHRGPLAPDNRLLQELRKLGTTSAEFHAALAGDPLVDAFRPEPVTATDRDAWSQQIRAQAAHTSALIARHHHGWAEPAATLGHALKDAEAIVAARLHPLDRTPATTFSKIRTHGDFHLGQTLKTTDGFAIIDFEGEPTKPLAARRRKQCALRDVAGMVRSLDYAAAVAGDPSVVGSLTDAFMGGYRARALSLRAPFVPSTPEAEFWMPLFELEKALYEVEYEANNRPDWVLIPLRAVARILIGPEAG